MRSAMMNMWRGLFGIDPQERIKVLLLSIIFFFIIGSYTITRDIKSSIFMSVVGTEYVPWAKVGTLFILVPLILGYSRLVDTIRRHQLLSLYSFIFGILGLLFTYLIGHPAIGISNTQTSPLRIFGWLFYFFVEAYSPFVVSVFWSYANSVTTPDQAKKNYSYIVSGSKIGGMLTSGIAWYLFSLSSSTGYTAEIGVRTHQLIMAVASIMVLAVPFMIYLLRKFVPHRLLHGYEAAYQVEKHKKHEKESLLSSMFSGLKMFIKYPYALGIFGMVFFYEVISTVMSFLRLGVAQANAESISDISRILFEMVFKTHAIGLVISLLGTRIVYNKLGTRISLLLIPTLTGLFLLYFMFTPTSVALINAFVALKAVHYAFSWPVRESLYIPTVKSIKFKTKSWIDAFGSKFAKTTGSTFNIIVAQLHGGWMISLHSFFFAFLIGGWFISAYLLGRRFDKAVKNNEVIGADSEA